jgi:hypothetical protein
MSDLANLKSVIERKSGHRPVSFDARDLRSRLGYDIDSMQQNGFDPSIIDEHKAFNDQLEAIFDHPELFEYLSTLTPEETYMASGITVLTVDAIKNEIQQFAPGALLFSYGFLPLASSVGGNIISFHKPTNRIVWADHDSFNGNQICFKDRTTKQWRWIPFRPENIDQALVLLATDLKTFLDDLLNDKLEKQLDELD